jgi:chorismate lyase
MSRFLESTRCRARWARSAGEPDMLREEHKWRPTLTCSDRSVHRWLPVGGSLTAAVRAASTDFRVRLLGQGWRKAIPDEAAAVEVSARERVWTREVLLGDAARGPLMPLVFAHSIVAARDLAAWPWLRGLGNRPLGDVLFEHPGVCRGTLLYRRIDGRHPLYHAASAAFLHANGKDATLAPTLWARRSVFVLHGGPLLVSEVFLPELLQR